MASRDRTRVIEREHDEHRLKQRSKQIEFGKNTSGYKIYLEQVPKDKRTKGDPRHPVTPDRFRLCSKRAFDGLLRSWRRRLHQYDPLPRPVYTYEELISLRDAPLSQVEPKRSDPLGVYWHDVPNPAPTPKPSATPKQCTSPLSPTLNLISSTVYNLQNIASLSPQQVEAVTTSLAPVTAQQQSQLASPVAKKLFPTPRRPFQPRDAPVAAAPPSQQRQRRGVPGINEELRNTAQKLARRIGAVPSTPAAQQLR